MTRIAFFYDVLRLDERMLLERLRRRAAVEPVHVASSVLPLGGEPPVEADIGVQRSISFYRAFTSTVAAESWGLRVVNTSTALAVAEDKAWSLSLLYRGKVPVPRTLLAYSVDNAVEAARRLGFPVVLKPLSGSWGRLAALASDEEAVRAVAEHREMLGSMYKVHYVQEYIEKPGRDIRAMCVGNEVVAAIYRVNGHWITNTARGGRAEPAEVDPALEDIVLRACRVLGVEVGGVDVVEDPERGYLVLEVNAVPEYKNIVRVTGVDVADRIASYLVSEARR